MKRTVQKLSRELFLVLMAVGALIPISGAQATIILPVAPDGSTVWAGNNPAALDAADIGAIVGKPGLGLFYDAQFGKAQIATSGSADGQVTFAAKQDGIAGHGITVEIVHPGGADSPLMVSVSGQAITITLATNNAGTATSTAAQVAAAVNASPAASGLVTTSAGGSGAGTVQTLSAAPLAPVIVETGPFASAYQTAFTNSTSFPQDASVTNGGVDAIDASALFLYVRGVGSESAYFIYDLLASAFIWNGVENLMLQGFGVGGGAIGQLSIVGTPKPTSIPEGSSLALLLLGIGLLAWYRGRARQYAGVPAH